MKLTTLIINLAVIIMLIISAMYNKEKTKQALKSSWKMFIKLLPALIMIMLLVSLVSGLIPRDTIASLMGEKAGWWGFSAMAILGAIAHIPSLVAFPLAGSLLSEGAGVSTISVFITTLTMIGYKMLKTNAAFFFPSQFKTNLTTTEPAIVPKIPKTAPFVINPTKNSSINNHSLIMVILLS